MAKSRADVQIDLDMDSSGVTRGITVVKKGIASFAGSALRTLGLLAGAAGFGGLATSAINLGSELSDLATQLNIGTTQLQTLRFAAQEAGVGNSLLERALRNVQLRTQEALDGNKRYADALRRLGLDAEKFNKLPTDKKMEAIARAQVKAKDSAAAYRDVAVILGERAGPALQEVLEQLAGKEGFEGLEEAAREAGQVMDEETIMKLDKAADELEKVKTAVTILAGEVLVKLIPALQILGLSARSAGQMIGTASSAANSFFTFIARAAGQVVQPVIKNLLALEKSFKALVLAAKGDIPAANKEMRKSLDLTKEAFEELVGIPEDISEEFTRLVEEFKVDAKNLDASMEENAEKIGGYWKKMWGEVEEASTATTEAMKESAKSTADDVKKTADETENALQRVISTAERALAYSKSLSQALGISDPEALKALESGKLEGLLSEREAQLRESLRVAPGTRAGAGGSAGLGQLLEREKIENEIARIREELDARSEFRRFEEAGLLGLSNFSFMEQQRLADATANLSESQKQTRAIQSLGDGISRIDSTLSRIGRTITE